MCANASICCVWQSLCNICTVINYENKKIKMKDLKGNIITEKEIDNFNYWAEHTRVSTQYSEHEAIDNYVEPIKKGDGFMRNNNLQMLAVIGVIILFIIRIIVSVLFGF